MVVLDRWVENLRCPICRKTGTARLSQADGWSVLMDTVPEGFRVVGSEYGSGGTQLGSRPIASLPGPSGRPNDPLAAFCWPSHSASSGIKQTPAPSSDVTEMELGGRLSWRPL